MLPIHRRRATAATLAATLLINACQSYRPVTMPSAVDERGTRHISFVTQRRGVEMELMELHVEADSLVGWTPRSEGKAPSGDERRAVAIRDVEGVEVQQLSVVRTLALAGGAALTTFVALLAVLARGYRGSRS